MESEMHKAWLAYEAKQKENAGIHGWYTKPTEFYAGWHACEAVQKSSLPESRGERE